MGHLPSLRVRLSHPDENTIFGSASFIGDDEEVWITALTPQELRRLRKFFDRINVTVL